MRKRGSNKRQGGSVLVEFALSFAVLFPLVTGSWDFGYAFLQYNKLCQGLRSGARYASVMPYEATVPTPTPEYLQAVRNVVVYGNPAGTGTAVVNGLTPAHVQLTMGWLSGAPNSVSLSLNGFPLPSLLTTMRINGPIVTFPYAGNYAATK